MKISTRALTIAGIGFVLLAFLLIFLKRDHGLFSETEGSKLSKEAKTGSNTRMNHSRENSKRERVTPGRSRDDPKTQKQAERWYQELLRHHPELQIAFKDVPDEQNGFLQFHKLIDELSPGEPNGATLPMEDGLREMLKGKTAFDAALVKDWISNNKELFQRILMIAEAPDQSRKGLSLGDRPLAACRPASEAIQLLQAATRSAFESGNPEEALRYHRASLNFVNQFDGVEIRNLWESHILAGFRSKSVENFHQNILPGLVDDPANLARWRESLPEVPAISDLSQDLLKSSWHIVALESLLPSLISMPDPADHTEVDQYAPANRNARDAIAEAYSLLIKDHMSQASNLTLKNLNDWSRIPVRENLTLSDDGTMTANMALSYPDNMIRNFGVYASSIAQHDALLAIALGEAPPPEPITGEPFLWDPEARTLSPPASLQDFKIDMSPLQLPVAR